MSALLEPMEAAAIFLLVPLAIIIGHRWPTGAIIVAGSVATIAAIVFWIVLGGFQAMDADPGSYNRQLILMFLPYGEGLLLITAWTLALYSAASTRRWGWVFLLVVAGYVSFAALAIGSTTPYLCDFHFGSGPACAEAGSLVSRAFQASNLVGPVVATLYGFLGLSARRRLSVPPSVVVTPLASGAEEDTEPGRA